jgi:hypothetical protein
VGFKFKGLGPCGFVWVFFCGLVWLLLCILTVYLGEFFSFLIKHFLLIKKKKFLIVISFMICFKYFQIFFFEKIMENMVL